MWYNQPGPSFFALFDVSFFSMNVSFSIFNIFLRVKPIKTGDRVCCRRKNKTELGHLFPKKKYLYRTDGGRRKPDVYHVTFV